MAVTTTYIPGKALSASFGGTDLTIVSSQIACEAVSLKATNKKSNGFREVIPSIKSWDGTLKFVVDANSPVVVAEGSFIDCVIGVAGGRTITGKGLVTSVMDDATIDGDYALTVKLSSSGSYTAA